MQAQPTLSVHPFTHSFLQKFTNQHNTTMTLDLRPPHRVMRLDRLGALHQTRISFVRSLVRKMAADTWSIERTHFELDNQGYGTCIYRAEIAGKEPDAVEVYSIIIFSMHLDDDLRSDRVIAEAWDVAFCLFEGDPSEDELAELRANLPKQEAGRCWPKVLVLSRANKSVRNFEYVVDSLANGAQPDPKRLAKVGYLYRTTAVYGNGKFGLADYEKLQRRQAFMGSFRAQMFTVYMLRQFSVEQANHMAAVRNPDAVTLRDDIARYLGVGNSTGLGMAPFLISHPLLINQWITMRETALACAIAAEQTPTHTKRFRKLVDRARTHVAEIYTDHAPQAERNCQMLGELTELAEMDVQPWPDLVAHAAATWSVETQEMIHSILIELYPELVDELGENMAVEEVYDTVPQMPLVQLRALIESRYAWALAIDFNDPNEQALFWYRSAEKEEPRLGQRYEEPGASQEMRIAVGRDVQECYAKICADLAEHPTALVAEFLLRHQTLRGTVRRIQSMGDTTYGDIQDNLLAEGCLPIDLLRCKLSFFGASKFDPKSSLWVRITLFQGAPLISELGPDFVDDWFLPTAPNMTEAL